MSGGVWSNCQCYFIVQYAKSDTFHIRRREHIKTDREVIDTGERFQVQWGDKQSQCRNAKILDHGSLVEMQDVLPYAAEDAIMFESPYGLPPYKRMKTTNQEPDDEDESPPYPELVPDRPLTADEIAYIDYGQQLTNTLATNHQLTDDESTSKATDQPLNDQAQTDQPPSNQPLTNIPQRDQLPTNQPLTNLPLTNDAAGQAIDHPLTDEQEAWLAWLHTRLDRLEQPMTELQEAVQARLARQEAETKMLDELMAGQAAMKKDLECLLLLLEQQAGPSSL